MVTQVDNTYSNQFYQPFTGPNSLNPGLSALTRMGVSDLFEDHKIVGGFRLALTACWLGNAMITTPDKQPFIDAMKPVYDKYVGTPELKDLVARIQATE